MMRTPRIASLQIRQCIRQIRPPQKRRSLHTVVPLPYENLEPQINGVYPLYSPEGFNIAWTERQKFLIQQVNKLTQGTALAHEELFNLIVLSANEPDMSPLFNVASSAWNNAFFMMGIQPQSGASPEIPIPKLLELKINLDFGSLAALRNMIFRTAMAIPGSGWVWLVVGPNAGLRVLASFNAGSPYDFTTRQLRDPNTTVDLDTLNPGRTTGMNKNRKQEYLILPVLTLNVWEHAYVMDYGCTREGKQQYLKNWWNAINWQRVFEAQSRTKLRRVEE